MHLKNPNIEHDVGGLGLVIPALLRQTPKPRLILSEVCDILFR